MKNPLFIILPLITLAIIVAVSQQLPQNNRAAVLTLSPEPLLTYSPTPTISPTPTPTPTIMATPTPTPTTVATPAPANSGTPDPAAMKACHLIRSATNYPANPNYAPPYNVVNGSNSLLIEVNCGTAGENVTAIAGTGNPVDYVYDKGYVFRDNQWHQLQLNRMSPTVQPVEPNWYASRISASFQMPAGKLAQKSFFLAYICHWNQGKWKCGCKDAACNDSRWSVQVFQRDGV